MATTKFEKPVGSETFQLQQQVSTMNTSLNALTTKVGNVGSTDLQTQVNTLNSNVANKHKRVYLGSITSPAAQTFTNLNEPVTNYEYVQIFFRKSGTSGSFVSQIISTDDISVGSFDSISFTAYNNNTYNFYAECGFSTTSRFNIATYHCTGWTMSSVWIVGIGKK